MLFDSLHQKLLPLGDDVEVYPAHGAGSLCGKQMRPERQSTIGKERALNHALRPRTKEEFVKLLTAELRERPGYFALDAEINRSGDAPSLENLPPIALLTAEEVLEGRKRRRHRARHAAVAAVLRGPYSRRGPHRAGGPDASWAATLLGLDKDILLIAEDQDSLEESRMRLARVGVERVAGVLKDGMAGWRGKTAEIGQLAVEAE